MNREHMLTQAGNEDLWDVIIIGGGATGLGAAIDAAARGYKTILLEQHDFAKGTSSRSTKLVHGGVRYLRQGNISLVLEALKERGILRQNAPHLVHDLPFVVPNYEWWEPPFYGVGLRIYDMLAGKYGFGDSRNLSKEETIKHIPTIETKGLRGGVMYYDGQFDDARLAIDMAATAFEQGAVVLNYMRVTGLIKDNSILQGVEAVDEESGTTYALRGKVVINATGVFTDSVRHMDNPGAKSMVKPSQGIHIVLAGDFLPGDSAIMVPHTDDGRVLFAIPWHGRTVVGTTDTPVDTADLEPLPLQEEIDYLLTHAARYLTKDPEPSDVVSMFAGLRPLVSAGGESDTAALSRDHTISISESGLLTIAGGKWTTYRKMAEDTIDQAALLGQLDERPCPTVDLRLHGYHADPNQFGDWAVYGSDAHALQELVDSDPRYAEKLDDSLPFVAGEVVWSARNELARTVEDVLSRRIRALLLDARKSMAMAPKVAALLAEELGRDDKWQQDQVAAYQELAETYVLT